MATPQTWTDPETGDTYELIPDAQPEMKTWTDPKSGDTYELIPDAPVATPKQGAAVVGRGTADTPVGDTPLEANPVQSVGSLAFKNDKVAAGAAQTLWDQGVRDPNEFNTLIKTKFPQYSDVNFSDGDIAQLRQRDAYYKARKLKNPGNFIANEATGLKDPEAPTTVLGAAGQGALRSLENMANSATGVAAWGADVVGADETSDALLDKYIEDQAKIQFNNPNAVRTAGDIESFDDALMYGADVLGELAPQLTSSLVSGGLGSAAGKKLAGEVAEDQVKKAATRGAVAGTAASTVGQETGSIYGDTYKETGVKTPVSSLIAGIAAGSLDTIVPLRALNRFGVPTQEVASRLITRLAKEGGKDLLIEGSTEAAQTFIEALPKSVVTGESPFTSEMLDNMVESFIRGGIGGAAVGTASAATQKTEAPQEDDTVEAPSRDTLDSYLNTQSLPPKTGEMRKRNATLKATRAEAVDQATKHVETTMDGWTNAPDFEVVPSWESLKDKTLRDGLDKDAVGAIIGGKMYINLKNVEDSSHLTSVVYHEALGHHGLAERFSYDLDTILDDIYDNGAKPFKAEIDKWMDENPDAYSNLDKPTQRRRAIEEVLSEMSENGALPVTIRDRVANFIKEYARKAGLKLKVSQREVRSILAQAHAATMKGSRGNVEVNGVRYMYAGRSAQLSDDGIDNLLSSIEADRQAPGTDTRGKTRWFKGPDDHWRIEMDDSKAAPLAATEELISDLSEIGDTAPWLIESYTTGSMLNDIANPDFLKAAGVTHFNLENILDHPELFAAYPELGVISVSRPQSHDYLGMYDPNTRSIEVSAFNDDPMSTLLHEIQHAIQHIEGWSMGGSNRPYVLDHMDKDKLAQGAARYVKYLEGTEDQLQKNLKEIQMVRNDPDVYEWHRLKMEDIKYADDREALRSFYQKQGVDPIDQPDYKALMDKHNAAFQKYMKYGEEFVKRNGFDPENMTDEQSAWFADIKWHYVIDPSFGMTAQNRAEKALVDLHNKTQLLSDLANAVEVGGDNGAARRELQRSLSRDDTVLFEAYRHLFGEVEARDVQKRQQLSEEERAATDPYSFEPDIDDQNYIFIEGPRGYSKEVVNISDRIKQVVDDEAEYWGITNIEKALTERDFRADVRASLAKLGLPQDSINLDPRIQKKLDVRYSKKRRVPRERDEKAEIAAAKDILDGVLQGYVPVERGWDEAVADARRAGLTSKQIRSAKGVGELDKRLFMYEKVAQEMNEKLANLHAKMDSDGFSMATKHKYLQTLAEFNELNAVIFRDQGEVGRALNAIKALQFTKNKLTMLNEALSQMQGNGFKGLADDAAFEAFAKSVRFMMESNNPEGVNKLVKTVLKPYWWQYLLSFRHSMMLSGLGTHAKNATDSALMIVRELEEAAIAAPGFAVRKGLQSAGFDVKDGVSPQEFVGRLYGLMRAGLDVSTYKDTIEAFKSGRGNTIYSSKTEVADARMPVISHVQDALHAADTFFRAFHNNSNLYAAGIRRARQEGYEGLEAFEEGSNAASSPDEALIKEAREMTDIALLVDRPSLWINRLEGLKAIRPGMKPGEQLAAFTANFLFPFFRVTDRLLFQKIRRSPIGYLDRVNREDLAAGGARMDIALGRMAYGSLLLWYYWSKSDDDDEITGSQLSDYDKQRALEAGGYQSNSVKKDNRYVDASALNLSLLPTDLQNSVAANIRSIRRAYDEGASEDDTAKALKLASMALLKELSSQSFAENLSMYIDPVKANNEATLDSAVGNVVGGFVGSFVPAAMRQYNAMYVDPIKRDTVGDKSIGDRVKGRVMAGIPGLSDNLPAKVSVYGDEQPQGRTLFSMDNYRDIKTDPESVELQRLERTTKKAVVVGAPSSFKDEGQDYKLNAGQRNEWDRLQGSYIKFWMKDLMADPEYKTMTDEDKIVEVKSIRKDAYELAKEQMLPKLTPSND